MGGGELSHTAVSVAHLLNGIAVMWPCSPAGSLNVDTDPLSRPVHR